MEPFSPSPVAFYLIALTAVAMAVLAVTSSNLVRASLALAFCLFSLAGIFWLLGSPFMAALQLLINAGAIPITTIFMVLMTHSRFSRLRSPLSAIVGLLVALPLLGASFLLVSRATGAAQPTPLGLERLGVELLSQRGATHTLSTGETMVVQGGTIVAFQVAAVILLVALVGAIIIAFRPGETTLRQIGRRGFDRGEESPRADA
ncbi:MAG: NADH-quinone oxidoreductase subunit J [Truepera sp.]|nr:NADH-quinone oxidoreductase subunit J [Truepera sp.]